MLKVDPHRIAVEVGAMLNVMYLAAEQANSTGDFEDTGDLMIFIEEVKTKVNKLTDVLDDPQIYNLVNGEEKQFSGAIGTY